MRTALARQTASLTYRTALRQKAGFRARVSRPFSFNAPVKGWIVSENIADMPKDAAYVLENWFPETESVRLREGYSEFATLAITGPTLIESLVRTLMVYSVGGGTSLFAATDEYIFDVTAGGDIVGEEVNSQQSDDYSWTNFTTTGGHYLIACNAIDPYLNFDGSSWTEPTITGATSADLAYPFGFKSRLFFIEENSTLVHYLPVDSITGTVSQLEVGGELTLGGTLVAGGALTMDGGEGVDDYCFFLSSEGEVVIYAGTDPSSADTWDKKGTYRIGRPIDDRCLLKIGGDVAVLCSDGVASLASSILLDRAAAQKGVFTRNIDDAFSDQYTLTGGLSGWQIISWPVGHMALVNIPTVANTTFKQYVMNVLTGAWAPWTGIDSACWALVGDNLYFGSVDGRVMRFGATSMDETEEISGRMVLAWSQMNSPGVLKHVKNAEVFMKSDGPFTVGAAISSDFADTSLADVTGAFSQADGAVWGTAVWGTDTWPATTAIRPVWLGVAGEGEYIAPTIFASVNSEDVIDIRFLSMKVVHETGAIIG